MVNINQNSIDEKRIRNVTFGGIIVNIVLTLLKIAVGIVIHSMALIADGVHSFSDLFTDIAVLVSSKAARKPPDDSHHYGHGKFETFGAQIIGITLLIVGGGIMWSALKSLHHHEQSFPGILVIIIAAISVVAKELLYQITKKIAMETHSSSVYANAWHHRSDALSSVAVLFGGVSGFWGFGYGDNIAGLVVGMMIVLVAITIIIDGFKELSEHAVDHKIVQVIEQILETYNGVNHWHKLRTRKVGNELFIDVHIHVDPYLTVLDSHQMTKELEKAIQENIQLPVNTLIHVEPHFQESRQV